MFADVILNTKQAGIGNGLTYRLPDGMRVKIGSLIIAPLRGKLIEGLVVDLKTEKPDGSFDIKEISSVISDEPLLTKDQIDVARWISDYYVCSLRQAVGLYLTGTRWSLLLPKQEAFVRLTQNYYTIQFTSKVVKFGRKQAILIEYLCDKDWLVWDEVARETGCTMSILKRLLEREFVEMKSEACRGVSCYSPTVDGNITKGVCLTDAQQKAHAAITADPRPSLLFGVTGSGKTEIYSALIRDAIRDGKNAILLLPEILLTENFVGRFEALLGNSAVAVIHSRLTPARRRDVWRRCREGCIRLVIGSRSALFAPLPYLGLIIIDEEHEWTYKNEQAPRYHAVKVAAMICNLMKNAKFQTLSAGRQVTNNKQIQYSIFNIPKLVLGSATPSVESWYKSKIEQYQLVELPERFGGATLPSVQIVDLAQVKFGYGAGGFPPYPLSPTLINAIRTRLDRREQSILFLNRRGFATSLICADCRYRFEDPDTGLPYTVHHGKCQVPGVRNQVDGSHLLSHHTGEKLQIPSQCPSCSSVNLIEVGAGTQKIEEILRSLFPQARLLRADRDTLTSPERMRALLDTMNEGRADILLGTQSVVKGLDLPKVTLAAVLLADVGLSLPHFRAGERVFQLLTQLTGRSGRRTPGEVIIQTYRPSALEVEFAAKHDIRGYLESELTERMKAQYPPETDMVRFVFTGPSCQKDAQIFVAQIQNRSSLIAYRLSFSSTPSLFSSYTWYVFLRGKNLREILRKLPVHSGTIDVDPIECL